MQRLKLGPTYQMMVLVTEQKRQYQKAGSTVYVHHITFVATDGQQYIGEYPTDAPTQNVFQVGKMSPQFKVTLEGKYGDEINVADFVYKPKPEPQPTQGSNIPINNVVQPMGGQSYVFAMGFAKDLMIPQLSDYDGQTGGDYKADLFQLADEINQWLIDKQREQQFNQM